MIRSVIALFVFAVLLCGWIVLRSTTGQPAPEVTRAATQDLAAPAQPSALRQRLQQQVAPQPVAPVAALAPAAPQPALTAPATATATAEEIQRAVQVALAPVKRAAAAPATPVQQAQSPAGDPMAQGVLANIRHARGLDQPAAAQPASVSLTDVVSQAIAQGQSDAYVEALLGAAHDEGLFEVDDALKTEDGRVDTRTLLSQIVHRASASAPAAAVPAPEAPIVGGAGVEVRTIQRADKTETYRFYTVQSGDSLGFIAQKFYGDAGYYTKIWEANRQIVSSPDRIRKGQRLVIPNI